MGMPDDYTVAIMVVPSAMPTAVMRVELCTWPAVVMVAIVVIWITADAEAETLGARDRRRGNRDGRQRGENA
jgi:hypothetical protein